MAARGDPAPPGAEPDPAGRDRRGAPWVGHAEAVLREQRMSALTGRRARILLALPVLAVALVITLPIPFGNAVPAVALIVIALGLMARDGVAILCGLGISVVALAWTGLLLFAGAAMLELALALLP
ncbi:MAG: exopolysaccharide biosynthesis protein [Dongiaceae bacterium]